MPDFNVMDFLKSIVDSVDKNTSFIAENSPAYKNAQKTTATQTTNPQSSLMNGFNEQNNANIGPYQEGVLKGLKKAGEEHAYNAAAMGMDPNQIMQHPVMQNTTQVPQQTQADTTASVTTPNNDTVQSKDQKFIANPNFLGFGGPDSSGNVRDTGTGIKILQLLAGGGVTNPAETAMKSQEMKGQKPAQKGELELVKAAAGFAIPTQAAEITQKLTDSYGTLKKNMSWMQKIGNLSFGYETPAMKSILSAAESLSGMITPSAQAKSQAVASGSSKKQKVGDTMSKGGKNYRITRISDGQAYGTPIK